MDSVIHPSFQVLIHAADEFPDVTKKGISVDSGTENFVALSAQVTES